MSQNFARVKLHRVRLSRLFVAMSVSLACFSAYATSSWAPTHTDDFVHGVLATPAQGNLAQQAFQDQLRQASAGAQPLSKSVPIDIVVSLSLRNESELDQFNRDAHTPGTPSFHRALTSRQVLDRYSPTQEEVDAVIAHLKNSGFTHIEASPNRLLVSAAGDAQSALTAFNTRLVQFTYQGRSVYANQGPAQVPVHLGGIVNAVLGLQTVEYAHTNHEGSATGERAPSSVDAKASSQSAHNPLDFQSIYDASSLPTASNTVVGIISEGNVKPVISDLGLFTSANKLPTVNTSIVQVGSASTDTKDNVEWDLDSQDIIGISGGVKQLIFYVAPSLSTGNLTKAYNKAVSDNVAKVINVSLGINEASAHSGGSQAADDSIFKIAVSQGQTFSVSAGDRGVYEASGGTVPSNPSSYSVSEPSSSPYVVSLGGTALYTTGATQFGSESVWNTGLHSGALHATGGGISLYETAPTWQTSALGSSVTHRQIPDVAYDADPASGAKIYVNGALATYGGTSLSAPLFAGAWARILTVNSNAGFAAPVLWKYLPSNPTVVHDVVTGNNGYNGYGYSASPGYDNATGWGSIDVSALSHLIPTSGSTTH